MTKSEKSEMQQELARCQDMVNKCLNCFFPLCGSSFDTLFESMRYSLLAGGKRLRAVICVKFCEAAGGKPADALPAACAIEMLHTYSLIHDDLPCMDDDDTRRGSPSNHIRYGESTALIAGDALQAAAFETILQSDLPPLTVADMARTLSIAAGPHGICGGQLLDLLGEGKQLTMDELLTISDMKTATLMAASARIGVIAGGGSPEQVIAADIYARALGLAFQVRDDILDCVATAEELGKPVGSDRKNNKVTFASLLGADDCDTMVRAITKKAIAALDGKFTDTKFLTWFARMLEVRSC